ncbi:uncharacterized protein LOC116615380 [Nematostella vectensis]|uniref:uncharacterized protein LOC116615380 n=1 Tax=Nematostella vectensis TaxID=45351 RepID=UPI002076EEF5|nr:uncharacterized protein LOC116615380 [Nematostella vectensis]
MEHLSLRDLLFLFFAWALILTDNTILAAHEKDEFRIYDRTFKATNTQMLEMIRRANLEEHGFTRLVSSHLTTKRTSGSQLRRDVHYTKDVPCSQLPAVEREVRALLPGVWGEDVSSRVQDIVFLKSLHDSQRCTAGIEIHFPTPGCNARGKRTPLLRRKARETREDDASPGESYKKRRPNPCPDWCIVCFMAQTEQ